ncbi:MAG TPA: preprotein translocase subunit SecG [Patescibacteria group bacterium]|nr:preprotein translocase subunit SecG [Patescibacteria group bacterium]
MVFILYLIHIAVCVVLIMVVLLQSGKAADLAGAFGGGGSQTALGSRGAATVLSKATTICAIIFMLTSLGLALVGSRRGGSVLENVKLPAQGAPAPDGVPAAPAGGAPANPAPAAAPGSTPPASPAPAAPAGQAAPAAPAKPPGSPK